jgi:hypothetical protein
MTFIIMFSNFQQPSKMMTRKSLATKATTTTISS